MTRRICVITGSRAEYGLLRWVIQGIRDSAGLELKLVATGMHLSPEFGNTYREIEGDDVRIDRRVEMLVGSSNGVDVAKSMAEGLAGFADVLTDLKPDILCVLGDRFEIFAAAAAATVIRIPIAHLHGGELSEGAYDEAFRHSITKMSHIHFVAAEEYGRRVIQLGEDPSRVFVVGGLGIDSIRKLKLLSRAELEDALGTPLGAKNLLVTFHPETLQLESAARQTKELLAALSQLNHTKLFFTMPNADADSAFVSTLIEEFVVAHPNASIYRSLGQLRYLSLVQQVDGVVGNSSSGLIEAPSLRKGTINIGDRQRGRLKAESVIDCEPECGAISAALSRLYSAEFRERLETVRNPYGEGGASEKIVQTLRDLPFDGLLKKSFYDIGAASRHAVRPHTG